ncbi:MULTISPECIES: hypothetical protein [Kribbella]|uniref:Cupin domain-containing protein n=1 Tax=Kribbella karoonensis TaxID=324851 RepID=A0ABP4QC31_9ACTN
MTELSKSEVATAGPQALVVGPDEGRELPMIGRVALSGTQTGGAFELIDFRGNAACPPPHIHRDREECIQVSAACSPSRSGPTRSR